MNRRLLMTSVLTGLLTLNASASPQSGRPKLVVNIVVDQLRTDYLEHLQGIFGPGGFNRLIANGVYMRDVDFKAASPDIANATAILSTGSWSGSNGVPAAYIYDPARKRMVRTLDSGSASELLTPEHLRLSTLSDEIAVGGNGLSMIYSIAADPQQSILMAGHAANSAIWIDPANGKWTTSSYYKELPAPAAERNFRHNLNSRLDTMRWKPALAPSQYIGLSQAQLKRPFSYSFSRSKEGFASFLASPMANREVTDLAIDCIKNINLGNRYGSRDKAETLGEPIDMLSIGYSLAPQPGAPVADCSFEQQDSYVRLDSQLARLFKAIDSSVGLDNSLVVISSTGYFNEPAVDSQKFRIPSGDFSSKKAVSLLNSFLSAKYGNAVYVANLAGGHLYLDHNTIESRRLDASEIIAEARAFLLKMSGVSGAYTLPEILASSSDETRRLHLSTDPKTGGDIILTFAPGWNVADDMTFPVQTKTWRSSATVTPAFILAPALSPTVISSPVDATDIAPTVTQILRIRSPNGASGRPLLFSAPR